MPNEIKGDQLVDRNLTVGGYLEIQDETVVTAPSSGYVRIHKRAGDNNLYIIDSTGTEVPITLYPQVSALSGLIVVLSGNLINSGNILVASISNETSSRVGSIFALSGALINSGNVLTASISNETSTRTSVDNYLQSEINILSGNLVTSGQILWAHTGSSSTTTASNIGTGVGIYSGVVSNDLKFKTLTSTDSSVIITSNVNTINLSTSGSAISGTNITISSGIISNISSVSGRYTFYISGDRRDYADVFYQNGNTDPFIEVPYYDIIYSSVSGNLGTVNIFATSSALYVENEYASSVSLRYFTQI